MNFVLLQEMIEKEEEDARRKKEVRQLERKAEHQGTQVPGAGCLLLMGIPSVAVIFYSKSISAP